MTVFWIAMAVPTVLWWRKSLTFVAFISVYANAAGHWAAAEGADTGARSRGGHMLDRLLALWRNEPVGVTAVVTTGIDFAVAVGAPIDEPVKVSFMALFAAVGFLVARQQVTPNAKVRARKRHPSSRR